MRLTVFVILRRNSFFQVSFAKTAYFHTKTGISHVLCNDGERGTRTDKPLLLPQALCRPRSSGGYSTSWSSRFDTATDSKAPVLALSCLLSSFSFFFHLKHSWLEFSTVLLKCQCILMNLLSADFANNAKLRSKHSVQGWNRSKPVIWSHEAIMKEAFLHVMLPLTDNLCRNRSTLYLQLI